jgi:amino acid adenylation domain-containing protein
MSVQRILTQLDEIGAELIINGVQLSIRAPRGAVSAELKRQVYLLRAEIAAYLKENEHYYRSRIPITGIRPKHLPLSHAQERLWVLEQIGGLGSAYNIPAVVRLRGGLDVAALERSFATIVERHEALRTRFAVVDGTPVQVIDPAGLFELTIEDLSELSDGQRVTAARARAQVLTQQPFDLERDPLLRAHLLRLSTEEHIAVVVMHHIVSDGWSMGVLIREVGALYAAFSQGRPSPLPELPIQYADYALWQRGWLAGEVLEKQVAYWREQLSGAPAALELPTDRARPAVQSFRGAYHGFALPADLTASVNELARLEGATLFMVLLAAFTVVLSRWSGQKDIVVSSAIAGRTHRELEGLIGFFVNTLALRTNLRGEPSFRELLGRVKEVALGAYAHQDVPFEKLVAELNPVRDLSRQPVFQVAFALQNVPQETLELPGLRLSRMRGEWVTSKFDLTLFLHEGPSGLYGDFEYATDLFDASTVDRLAGHLRVLLDGIVADPDARASELPLLGEVERHQLLSEWNATAADYPRDKCLHDLFAEQAARTPDAVALVYEDSALTYGELDRRANQLGHHLQKLGVGPEVIVGLCVERSLEMVVGLLGILKAGGAYLPLDPTYPAERLAYMVSDAQAPVLLTQRRLVARMPQHAARVVQIDVDWVEIERCPATSPPNMTLPDNLVYVIYTSGSTGRPKGVMLRHGGVCNLAQAQVQAFAVGPESQVLQFASLSFDASISELAMGLYVGAAVRLSDITSTPLFRNLSEITIATLPPSALQPLSEEELPALQTLVVAGEACPPQLARRWAEGRRFINAYGPTETTVCATSGIYDGESECLTVPIGRPISNTQIYVLDDDLGPVPIGVPGELYIGGAGLARGYLGRAGLTGERFVPSPFGEGERLYRTGDLARWRSDGELEYLGRVDHQVKVRGYRIELGEIEAALVEHSDIRQAVVVAREDEAGDKRLVAYVVRDPGDSGEDGTSTRDWEDLYNETYGPGEGPSFVGWNSSYTGAAIPENEMEEWLACTVERISGLKPDRVLEIGCGTGLLLQHLAPRCQVYRGFDISAAAIERLKRWLETQPGAQHVELSHRQAIDLGRVERCSFDTVILNSVVQYFPNVDYLLTVLKGAVELISSGGRLFVGDIRHFGLLSVFHTSVKLAQPSPRVNLKHLKSRIKNAIVREKELVIDPAFFLALQGYLPRVCSVEVLLKRGHSDNELTRYRYDVVLHIGERPPMVAREIINWQLGESSIVGLERYLTENRPATVCITNIPNRRLEKDLAGAHLLETMQEHSEVEELRRALLEIPIVSEDPEMFWKMAEAHEYEAQVSWTVGSGEGCFDVLFKDRTRVVTAFTPQGRMHTSSQRSWHVYTNNPANALRRHLAPALRDMLQQRLPEYMVPSAYVELEALPLTPNGKVDRRALPAPDDEAVIHGEYEAPRTPTEEVLAGIWAEVLQLDRVGVHDNFFELGGHSLLAMRMVARIRDGMKVELPLRALFEAPSVGELAGRIEAAQREGLGLVTPPLVVRTRPAELPLSHAQERLWVLEQIGGLGSAYNIPAVVRLRGGLDVAALERSFATIVERHEALRTRFAVVDGAPVQVIDPPGLSGLEVEDLSGLAEGDRAAAARDRAEVLTQQPFDLERDPLLRAHLLRLSTEEHIAVVVMHHIVSDGWSMGVLIREVGALYAAYVEGRPSPLPALPIQYAEYALWQRGWLAGEVLEKQVSYWREHLNGAPAALELPTDRARPAVESYRGAHHGFALPGDLTAPLNKLARSEGATLFMVLLSAFTVVLSRWSGQSDIVVGSPIAGRMHRELEGLIGFFVNMLVLRTQPRGTLGFSELVQQVKEVALGAYAHQDLPFEKLVAELQPVRDLSRHPIFQVTFALQNVPQERLQLPGLELRPAGDGGPTAKFDLSLYLQESDQGLRGHFEYATDLFEASTIERLAGHLRVVLEAIVADPQARIGALPLLEESERRQLLEEWNDTAAACPRNRCVHEMFVAQATMAPDAIAIVFEDQQLSYSELDRRSNQLAHYLRSLGIWPEVVVGVCVERSLETIIGLIGILKAGGAYLPLDPSYPNERFSYLMGDSRATVVLTQASIVERMPPSDCFMIRLDTDWVKIKQQSTTPLASNTQPDSLAYVIYTSGSTGKPKGVTVQSGDFTQHLLSLNSCYHVTPADTVMLVAAAGFDVFLCQTFMALCFGARLAIAGNVNDTGVNPIQAMLASGATTVDLSTPLWISLSASWPLLLSSSVRLVVIGADSVDRASIQRWREVISNKIELLNTYGPTEAVVECTKYDLTATVDTNENVAIGRPLPGRRLYVLDQNLQLVPVGVTGELHVGEVGLARGYLHRPGLTAERFVANPFGLQGSRLYRTGDLARWRADGELEFLGRVDHQVKIRGYRIELGEIEARLGEHGSVGQAVVVAREDTAGEKRLVAYVVAADAAGVDAGELRAHLKHSLPDYMVPAAYVVLEALPLTATGKVDRRALPIPAADAVARSADEAPRTPSEEVLAAIWCEVLKLERVGVHDNFFELGGHSLLAIRVLERMRQQRLHCSVRALFTEPTIAGLAAAVSRDGDVVEVPPNRIVPGCDVITAEMLPLITLEQAEIDRIVATVPGGVANVQDVYPLAPLQEGILFHHLMETVGDPYLFDITLSLDSRPRLDAFVQALQAVIDRNDILRTAMAWEGLSEPVQVVWRRAPLVVEEVMLEPAAGQAVDQLRSRFDPRSYRLDVRHAPLLRAFVAHDAAGDRWLLLLVAHHLAIDHTTLEILIEEVGAHALGRAERLASAVPFRNFVAHARLGVNAQEHEAFFRDMLRGIETPTVPFGLTNVHGDGRGIAEARRRLDEALAKRLRMQARALGVGAASLFHVAWAQVLARLSGRDDVVFGTVLFGRLQGGAGADRAVGLLLNTLPVRIRVAEEGVQDSVRRTHRLLMELLHHEHASLVLAQRCSGVPASMPLFNAVLNYRHSARATRDSAGPTAWKSIRWLAAQERTNYPLALMIDDMGEGFVLTAQVSSPLDPSRICEFIQTALEQLSNALENAPSTPLGNLDVLPATERRQLLEEWNETAAAYPREACLHELFGEETVRTPDATAVVYEAPRTPSEEVLAAIWCKVLKLERVGVHDNFFELGGHSLLAMRVIARIREELAVELPLRALFEAPSVAKLSDRMRYSESMTKHSVN